MQAAQWAEVAYSPALPPDAFAQLSDVVAAMQRGMRVTAVGLDYARYDRCPASLRVGA